jgi:hypothetical protein
MESLTKTTFFCMLLQKNEASEIENLSLTYKEFMQKLVHVCTTPTGHVPAFFILNYTRLELIALKKEYKAAGINKDVPAEQFLLKAVLAVESAMDWLQTHKNEASPNVENNSKPDFTPQWTSGIIDLLEMSMALHERKAINNGEVPITTVVNFFFNQFGLKPGNFFSTYGVMRARAKSRTLFLDELKGSLENKMDRDDNKEIKHNRGNSKRLNQTVL